MRLRSRYPHDSSPPKAQSKAAFWIIAIALLAGLLLSFFSYLEICVEHCSANQDYRLLGFPFAPTGILFFGVLFIGHLFSRSYLFLTKIIGWFICIALGSEVMFIGVQKYEIGHWCPVCLSIALALLIASLPYLAGYIKNLITNKGEMMNHFKQALTSLSLVALGFLIAFFGVSKINPLEAAAAEMKERLAFGKKGAPIEVYFVTDWYCPACKKVEPLIQKLYPDIKTKATFFFVDYPIHKNSNNFVPYNLAFLVNSKSQYFDARNALSELAATNETPTEKDIQELVKKYKIRYKELPFVDVKTGSDFFEKVVEKHNLNSTPDLIFINTKTKKVIKLEGLDQINEDKIKEALDSITKNS